MPASVSLLSLCLSLSFSASQGRNLISIDRTLGSAGGMPDECGGGVLIIDEADRMLGLGFERPIRRIMAHAPSGRDTGRQTLLFSATWSR